MLFSFHICYVLAQLCVLWLGVVTAEMALEGLRNPVYRLASFGAIYTEKKTALIQRSARSKAFPPRRKRTCVVQCSDPASNAKSTAAIWKYKEKTKSDKHYPLPSCAVQKNGHAGRISKLLSTSLPVGLRCCGHAAARKARAQGLIFFRGGG